MRVVSYDVRRRGRRIYLSGLVNLTNRSDKKLYFVVQDEEITYDLHSFEISSCTCMNESFRGNKSLDVYSCRHREAVRHWVRENIHNYLQRGVEADSMVLSPHKSMSVLPPPPAIIHLIKKK